ncbi:MAG: hypothetical protein GYB53_23440 [Rhodobacteraceae bacterium]|nr:hypothetical protein [Paracoccaceae bacterium]MBR9819639.1 hypothetical protein [Paracoccaceae bacterium]
MTSDLFESRMKQAAEARGLALRQVELRDGRDGRQPWLEIDHPSGRFQYRRGHLGLAQVLRPERPGRSINQLAEAICDSQGALQAHLAEAGLPHWQGWLVDEATRDAVISAIPRDAGMLRLRPETTPGQQLEPGQIWHADARRRALLRQAGQSLLSQSGVVSIEGRAAGRALFVLATRERALAAQFRSPPRVVGDGSRSLLTLIASANEHRATDHRIRVDEVLLKVLEGQGLALSDRPEAGRQVVLARSYDATRGFHAEGLGSALDPGLAELACKAVRSVPGLHLAAVEILIPEGAAPQAGPGVHLRNLVSAPELEPFADTDSGAGSTDLAEQILALLDRPEIAAMDPWVTHAPSFLDGADPALRGLDAEARAMAFDLARAGLPYRLRDVAGDETTEARRQVEFDLGGQTYTASHGARRIVTADGGSVHVNTGATRITGSKSRTKASLEAAGIATPQGRSFARDAVSEAIEYARRMGPGRGGAVCIKPARGHAGILVHPACRTEKEIRAACEAIAARFGEIIVEESLAGEDVRFFYVKPRVVGLLRAVRPQVVGNGRDSVLALLGDFNASIGVTGRQRDLRPGGALVAHLLTQGVTLQTVLAPGQTVTISPISNAAAPLEGGQRMEDVHPSYLDAACRAFEAIPGLRVGAMDTILRDRSQPATADNWKVLEINSSPGVLTHFLPTFPAEAQPFTPAFLDLLRREGDQIAEEAEARRAEDRIEEGDRQIFEQINAALAEIETSPAEVIADHQYDALMELLDHAVSANPFYAQHLARVFRGDDFSPEGWADLPLLGRDEVRLLGRMLHSESTPEGGPISTVTTSGSSGSPLSIRWNRVATISTRAAVQRMYDWNGLDFSAPYAGLRSFKQPAAKFPGMRMARSWNDTDPDAPFYALSVETPIEKQLDWLEMVRPRYLNTYPSLAAELAELALARGSDLRIEAILTAGEVLTPRIRALCAEGLGAKVIDSYGCQELGKIALQCEHPEGGLHIATSNVLVEVLDDEGRQVRPGGTGRVVLTSLYNYAMPFIRYDIGDYATLSDKPCPCGRNQPVLAQVHGRRRNLIALPGGDRRWLPGRVLSELSRLADARHARLVQTAVDHCELRYVPAGDTPQADDSRLTACAAELIHPEMRVTSVAVRELERGASGKLEDVVGLESHTYGGGRPFGGRIS